ncbi:MAG TPA: glycosyl hydrolase [Nocardioidaceae bacterium]|nr:glycosyl hydrolase [Nocardioidaceae bacterium]
MCGVLVVVVAVVVVRSRDTHCDELPGPGGSATRFGLTVNGLPDDFTEVDRLRSEVGATPQILMWYTAWQQGGDFPADAARRAADAGAVPQVTWEPWDPAAGAEQQSFPLDRIAGGDFDDYVSRWADQAAAYAGPVMIRFAHEMNTPTYPWGAVEGRNQPSAYVDAWRHVHDVFSGAGATNVTWVWSPNVPFEGSTDLASVYPGDDYVDAVALDGYNWSTLQPASGWQSFEEIFASGLDELDDVTDRPRLIGEVGSAEEGGDKGAWVEDMFATLGERREICGFTWFNLAKETDWRIESSPGSLEAFRTGLAARE